MSVDEHLQASIAGADIETIGAAKILLDFIKTNWEMTGSLATAKVDFGAHPTRTNKDVTLNCYRIISNIYDRDVGSHVYRFDVPVVIDAYVRDAKAAGLKDTPSPKLESMEIYLRDFIAVNRLGLRGKGINNMMISSVRYPAEETNNEKATKSVWFHMVIQIRMAYNMFRVPN